MGLEVFLSVTVVLLDSLFDLLLCAINILDLQMGRRGLREGRPRERRGEDVGVKGGG